MPKKKSPLPTPPGSAFGPRKRLRGEPEGENLLADKMALALSQGNLNEFLAEEFPGNENARKLANVMMQMTGMAPTARPAPPLEKPQKGKRRAQGKKAAGAVRPSAAEDAEKLASLLGGTRNEEAERAGTTRGEGAGPGVEAFLDKDVIDTLMKVAEENRVSIDWVMARALRLYARDYITTGRI
jgi:hypothetical protein